MQPREVGDRVSRDAAVGRFAGSGLFPLPFLGFRCAPPQALRFRLLRRLGCQFPDRFAEAIRTETILIWPSNHSDVWNLRTPTRQSFSAVCSLWCCAAGEIFAAVGTILLHRF